MQIQFLGAAKTVTGSKHLIITENGEKIMLDCGFFQGKGSDTDALNRHLGFNPLEIDYVILSHAHIDHSGNLPNLVKQGFKGKIISTTATFDLCKIMLEDSAHIQESDLKYINKRKAKRGEETIKPIYDIIDVKNTLAKFITVDYNANFNVTDNIELKFTDSGHILGSAAINLKIKEKNKIHTLCFTGDIGRYNGSILKDPHPFPQAETIICESTYGDRLHSDSKYTEKQLFDIVYNTCVAKKGKLIIPAFSLGRTQELVYALDKMANKKMLPKIKVYVDSPLSVNATAIMRAHPECFNKNILDYMKNDPNPFGFNNLIYIQDVEASKQINDSKEPCIIISASGMMEAGRIKHHVANNITNPSNTILMVGYAEPNSLGGKLRNGEKIVRIFGDDYNVKAEIVVIDSYSAHADYKEMIEYLSCQDKKIVKKMFLVHGEYEVQINFKEKLKENGFNNIYIPSQGESYYIN